MVGIYKITNLVNGKIYVGQSIDIIERWNQHKWKAFNPNEVAYKSAIHNAFRKYGIENFQLEVIEECSVEMLDDRERFWIQELDCLVPNGYNILIGGQQIRSDRVCSNCGGTLSYGTKTHLCRKCYEDQIRAHIPDKETLYNLLIENKGNFTFLGKMFGVTDNAVRKWCKKYNLPSHTSDYKKMSQ